MSRLGMRAEERRARLRCHRSWGGSRRFLCRDLRARGGDGSEFGFGVAIGGGRIRHRRSRNFLVRRSAGSAGSRFGRGARERHTREVAVGMVFAHDVSDDAGALAGGAIGLEAHLLHGIENAAVHGLSPSRTSGRARPMMTDME